jgi:glutamyl-tRNA reductase
VSELLLLGVSHKTAPVELRERVALPEGQGSEQFLRELAGDADIQEAVVISTCNRTEVYVVTADPVEAESRVLGLLARRGGIRPTALAGSIYAYRNCDAARHLYRVAAGLESMIVGEHEIQGQVRRSYDNAVAIGTTGPLSNRVFGAALSTGGRVRSETGIADGRTTLPTVAVDLIREPLGDLGNREVLILGTGEMAELSARALAVAGARLTFVANRRRESALALASRFGGHVAALEDLPEQLATTDVLFGATASPHPIIGPDELAEVMRARHGRPLLLVDIAVPRDIDPLCSQLDGVTRYDLDDLQGAVERNMKVRHAETDRAEAIIEEEIQRFAGWLGSLEAMPTIAALRERGDAIVDGVLADNANRWEDLSDADRERVEVIARTVMKRLLHEPTLRLRRTEDGRAHARLQILRDLFGLDDSELPAEGGDADSGDVRDLRERKHRA